jgi:glycosyltransferase involved in cell wall biosynthesis
MNRRLRIAFFSPFHPQKSGIADYSEELLPYLAKHAEIDLITGPYCLSNDTLTRDFRIRQAPEFLRDNSAYDVAIYQVGNNFHHHGYMVPCMTACPGIVVLHDYCLQYLTLGLTLRCGKFRALVETLRPAYGRRAGWLATRLLFNIIDSQHISFAWPLIAQSKAVVVHSQFARKLVQNDAPRLPVQVIPMGVPNLDAAAAQEALRARYGLDITDFVLASISTISHAKRLDVVLRSLRDLKRDIPRLKYLVVGGGNLGDEVRRLIRDLDLQDTVVLTGWVGDEEYRGLIALADVIVDLRYPSGAETSASLTRAIALGKPLILSEQGSFLEMPEDFSLKIPIGNEQVALPGAVRRLVADGELRAKMSQSSRAYFLANLQLAHTAQAYAEFCEQASSMPAPSVPLKHWVSPAGSFAKLVVSSVYKASRVGYLYRHYGWRDTLRRIREEVGADSRPETV